MPTISIFFGIVIQMYWRDHAPPHFHAHYQGNDSVFEIESGKLIAGKMSAARQKIVSQWAVRHRSELMTNWELANDLQPFNMIIGADAE